jgi:hypothetical protein
LGGKVVLHGDVYDDAFAYAKQLEQQQDLVFIHPYDDIEVIAGQATIAKELLEQNRRFCNRAHIFINIFNRRANLIITHQHTLIHYFFVYLISFALYR